MPCYDSKGQQKIFVSVGGYKNLIDCPGCVYGTLVHIMKNFYYCIDCGKVYVKENGKFRISTPKEREKVKARK